MHQVQTRQRPACSMGEARRSHTLPRRGRCPMNLRLLWLGSVASALILSLPPTPVHGAGGDLLWQAQFDFADGNDVASAMAAADGRVVAVSTTRAADGSVALSVRAYDARTGALLWEDRVNDAAGTSVAMNGRLVVVSGTGDVSGSSQSLIRAYLARTGTLLWQDSWPGDGFSLRLALEGAFLAVAGGITDTAGVIHPIARAYIAAVGAVLWTDRSSPLDYTGPGWFGGVTLRDGVVHVAGTVSRTVIGTRGCLVRRYAVLTGARAWETVRDATATCTPLAVAADRRRVVLTGLAGIGHDDFFVQAFDAATGGFLWQDRTLFGSTTTNEGTSVELANGQAIVSGWRMFSGTTPGLKETFFVRSYDADSGVLRWENTHQVDELGVFMWHGLDLDVARGRVFAVGQAVGYGTWLVRALELSSGDVIWQRQFEPDVIGANYGWTQAAAVDGGRLFVAGSVFNAMGNSDALVRGLDAR